jgi:hypothetical protein
MGLFRTSFTALIEAAPPLRFTSSQTVPKLPQPSSLSLNHLVSLTSWRCEAFGEVCNVYSGEYSASSLKRSIRSSGSVGLEPDFTVPERGWSMLSAKKVPKIDTRCMDEKFSRSHTASQRNDSTPTSTERKCGRQRAAS